MRDDNPGPFLMEKPVRELQTVVRRERLGSYFYCL